jgi:hypothetical protein
MTQALPGRAEVDALLEELEAIARAAHALLAHPRLEQADRERGLLQLLVQAKASRVPQLACEAILRQIDAALDGTLYEPPRPVGDGWARRQRVLRGLGYARCPTCRSEVADERAIWRLEGSADGGRPA